MSSGAIYIRQRRSEANKAEFFASPLSKLELAESPANQLEVDLKFFQDNDEQMKSPEAK